MCGGQPGGVWRDSLAADCTITLTATNLWYSMSLRVYKTYTLGGLGILAYLG